MIEDLVVKPQKIIKNEKGNILHALKKDEEQFNGFGEAYFSLIKYNAIKAWRRHNKATMNLIVPFGKIKLVVLDDRKINTIKQEIFISVDNYVRVTIPPKLWTGFIGLSKDTSIVLNVTDIQHDPEEKDTRDINHFDYEW